MTLKEYKKRVKIEAFGLLGRVFDVQILVNGKKYTCESKNRDAYLAILYKAKPNSAESSVFHYTERGAYEYFYRECRRKNHLKY